MTSVEFCSWDDYIKGKRKLPWWKKANWHKVILYTAVVLFIYDVFYGFLIYYYVNKLNANQELRLEEYRKNSTFSTLFYSLHRFFGDPALQEKDVTDWQGKGQLV